MKIYYCEACEYGPCVNKIEDHLKHFCNSDIIGPSVKTIDTDLHEAVCRERDELILANAKLALSNGDLRFKDSIFNPCSHTGVESRSCDIRADTQALQKLSSI